MSLSGRFGTRKAYTDKTMNEADIADMTKKIGRALMSRVKITERRGGAGQIVISFNTRAHLNEIVEKIAGKK